MKSQLEEILASQLQYVGGMGLEREYKFHPTRKWRFDFAWPQLQVAVEIEGGIFVRGRHSRGVGIRNDCEKYNQAALLGWIVLRYTDREIKNRTAYEEIKALLIKKRGVS